MKLAYFLRLSKSTQFLLHSLQWSLWLEDKYTAGPVLTYLVLLCIILHSAALSCPLLSFPALAFPLMCSLVTKT